MLWLPRARLRCALRLAPGTRALVPHYPPACARRARCLSHPRAMRRRAVHAGAQHRALDAQGDPEQDPGQNDGQARRRRGPGQAQVQAPRACESMDLLAWETSAADVGCCGCWPLAAAKSTPWPCGGCTRSSTTSSPEETTSSHTAPSIAPATARSSTSKTLLVRRGGPACPRTRAYPASRGRIPALRAGESRACGADCLARGVPVVHVRLRFRCACAADAVNVIHGELIDLKAYLQGAVGSSQS